MKYSVLIIACLLLASCATMKNPNAVPDHGPCLDSYHDAQHGEKEALAGAILLPSGLLLMGIGFPILIGGAMGGEGGDAYGGLALMAVGGLAFVSGIITLIDGNMRVNEWNDTCTGATAAERYCLFEPLSEQKP
ncbi:MAG TPA: hypothetical protein PLV42_07160 [bacterium]|nr:hypothetical protein [bacterium]